MQQSSSIMLVSGLLSFVLVGQSRRNVLEESPSRQSTAKASSISNYDIYTLQCQVGNKFLQVAGDTLYNEKFADSARVEQAGALPIGRDGSFQEWYLVACLVDNVRYYQLRNVFSGKLLTSPSKQVGEQLVQAGEAATLSDQQLWQVSPVTIDGTTVYQLINKGNSLVVTNQNSSTSDNTPITQETLQPTLQQQYWALALQLQQCYRDDQATRFFERNNRGQGSVAFDGGASVPLHDGRVLWLTSDAYDGQSLVSNSTHLLKKDNSIAYRNTVLVQPTTTTWSSDAHNLTNSSIRNDWTTWYARQIFNAPVEVYPSGQFAWPYAGVEVDDHVYAWASEGNITGKKITIKKADGTKKTVTVADTAAILRLGQTGQALYDLTEETDTSWASARRIVPNGFGYFNTPCGYNAGMVKSTDGYVYTFGATYNQGDDIYVARFKPHADSVRTGWRYWNGTGWAKTPSKSSAAIVGKTVSNTSICYIDGTYVAVSMDVAWNCDGNRYIFVSTSTSPTGPFTNQHKVYAFKEYMYGKKARLYVLHTHPNAVSSQAVNGYRELLVTYSSIFFHPILDSGCYVAPPNPDGLNDPYFYRLRGVRIPYSLLGGGLK